MERITSRQNALAVHIRRLNADRRYRREQQQFVCEGFKLLDEALRWGAGLTTVVGEVGKVLPPLPPDLRRVEVPEDLLKSLSDTDHPQGVLFLCRMPSTQLPAPLEGSRYLVLDGVQDPGNVGTIWRTADAFGADGLLLLPGCADPWGPKTVRATMGAVFRLPVWEVDLEDLKAKLDGADLPLVGAALREDAVELGDAELTRGAVVIGSEGGGISGAVLDACARTVKIPMRERCESLNAAVAASVVLWEMGAARRKSMAST